MNLTSDAVRVHLRGTCLRRDRCVNTVGAPAVPRLPHTGKVTQSHVNGSEWTKPWSLRSTRIRSVRLYS